VVSLWNNLPNVASNCFKSRLDKFWNRQDVLYNWEADFAGTRNQSFCSLQIIVYICFSLIRDEDMDIEALPVSVNLRCLGLWPSVLTTTQPCLRGVTFHYYVEASFLN